MTEAQREMSQRLTQSQCAAVERWIEDVKPPTVAHDAIRRKFALLDLSCMEIDADRLAKMRHLKGNPKIQV